MIESHSTNNLPRILILDDLFGRNVPGGRNTDRENLCAHFLWKDVTGDDAAMMSRQKVLKPVVEAFFTRAQTPDVSDVGSVVENNLDGALAQVRKGWNDAFVQGRAPWAMVLVDLCFYTGPVTEESHRRTPGMPEGRASDDNPRSYFGLSLLDAIHSECPDLPVMILSSKPREEVSLEFNRRGALGFIDRSDLCGPEVLGDALWRHGLLTDPEGGVIGNSLPVLLALREARRAARHRENLLIRGERGTGKELMARYVHRVSGCTKDRKSCELVIVNSAVLMSTMFASELFGIEPKTATGVDGKIGLIEVAAGGDLFLDEIADMPPEVQAAVLRVLQERQITPVGARVPKSVDVRFLSATNADLERDSKFRPDLLDRLQLGGTIWLPPLRERLADIPLLVEKFVRGSEAQRHGTMRREITPEAMEILLNHDWPGNVRELRSCLFDAVNRHPDVEYLVPSHLRIAAQGFARYAGTPTLLQEDVKVTELRPSQAIDLALFQDVQADIRFDQSDISKWAGKLADLQHSHVQLLSRYLQAALEATKRRTPENPDGLIQIHPAVKLITGDATLTASKSADVVKRLLGPIADVLDGDLREAYDTAVRLRPKTPTSRSK